MPARLSLDIGYQKSEDWSKIKCCVRREKKLKNSNNQGF